MSGILYIIGTPIGIYEDITLQALKLIPQLDIIASENLNTNKKRMENLTGPLSNHWIPYFDGNEITQSMKIISMLKDNKNVGLISSAGMPMVCDPGYRLIQQAYKYGIKVEVIGGPSAVTNGLAISGAKPFPFIFIGFFPKKIKKDFLHIMEQPWTIIGFESSHRIVHTVEFLWNHYKDTKTIILIKDMGFKYFQRIVVDEYNYNQLDYMGQWVVVLDHKI